MRPKRKRRLFRTLCAIAVLPWLAACSIEMFGSDQKPTPAAPAPASTESETEPAAAAPAAPPDVALVVGTAPQQRIEAVKPGGNTAAALVGDTKHVDYGSGALTADYGALEPGARKTGASAAATEATVGLPPPPPEEGAGSSGPALRAPAGEPEVPDVIPAEEIEPPAPAPQQAAVLEPPASSLTEPTPDAQKTAAAGATGGNGAFVQLAAFKSPTDVAASWAAMQRKHPELLADLSLTMRPVDLGDRGLFYRLLAGPLPDVAAARKLCTALQARGQDCLVRPN